MSASMNFEEALKAMKMGNKVSREAWRGIASYWAMPKNLNEIHKYTPSGLHYPIKEIPTENIFADDWWIVT